jgi:hypothetical protein
VIGALRQLADFALGDPMSGVVWVVLWASLILAWLCGIVHLEVLNEQLEEE